MSHVPARLVVLPLAQRIMRRERRLDGNGNLCVLHVLPAQVFGSVDGLALAALVHEHAKLLAN